MIIGINQNNILKPRTRCKYGWTHLGLKKLMTLLTYFQVQIPQISFVFFLFFVFLYI